MAQGGHRTSSLEKRAADSCSGLKVFAPWDLLRGRDVFKHVSELDCEDEEADLAHYAPNCATFSRAREIPIPGVLNAPKPIRSSESPLGIPEELKNLSRKALTRLENDSFMAQDSARRALARHRRRKFFSLEHPLRSIAMDLPEWRELLSTPGVFLSKYHTCMFEGSKRKKAQALIHNMEELKDMEKVCNGSSKCDRSGQFHERWRPVIAQGKVKQFVTGEEREYPRGFCEAYASCVLTAVKDGRVRSFLEIYSGPNAPLSNAVSLSSGGQGVERFVRKSEDVGREKQTGEDLKSPPPKSINPLASCKSWDVPSVENTTNRVIAVESFRQPSFGKRTQLIKDGLNNPYDHLKMALKLVHPFDKQEGLKEMHLKGLEWTKSQKDANQSRLDILESVRVLKQDPGVRKRDAELKSLSGPAFEKLGKKLDLGLMEALQDLTSLEDKAIPLLCATGMTITGRALESPFFLPQVESQKVTREEFVKTSKRRRAEAIKRTLFMSQQGGHDMASAIWSKAQKEIAEGSMGPSMTLEEAEAKFGNFFNVVPCFGLQQGLDNAGKKKYRRIDDHTAGWVNLAAKRMQRIEMANVDYIATMVKASSKSFPSVALEICTADMQSAYRQVPLAEQDVPASITAIYDPESRQVKLHEMYGQPFGAGHAVPNFYRVAEWFCRLVVRLYGIQCDHFFDDYWIVDRAENSRVSLKCLLETAQLLGIRFDLDKTQLPAKQAEVLGVLFDLSDIQTGSLCIKAKPKRAENLIANIDSCMQSNMLTASQAASIVGKFGFLCSTLFGKAGRCASLGVRARQYTSSSDTTMNPSLTTSLKLMQEFLRICPPRQLSFHSPLPPFVLYSDASDVPERKPRFGVGGVLVDQRFHPKLYQLELLAGPVSLTTWGQQVLDAKLLHFVDNDAASSCLVKGYSPKTDSSELVGIYWLTAAAHRVSIYIDRVESKSNLSDGPSRFDNELLTRLGSLEVKPILPPNFFLDSVSSWFQLPAT